MERILTASEIKKADDYTINTLGIPEEELIIAAGKAVAEEIKKHKRGGRVLVVCGKGNNGADGRVIAEELKKIHGFSVFLYDVALPKPELLSAEYDIIADCLLGTGLNGAVRGECERLINKMNAMSGYKVACDIPSGLNADTGRPQKVSFKADLTVAVQEYKRGHFFGDGIDYCGKTVAKDIGISIWGDFPYKLTDEDAAAYFKKRKRNVNKGDFSKAAVIGGSKDFYGAPVLSLSSLMTMIGGAGYGYLYAPESYQNLYKGFNPECIVKGFLDDGSNMALDETLAKNLNDCKAVAFGMGLGVTKGVYDELCDILSVYKGTLIIDADGINALSLYGKDVLKSAACKVIITPHMGEFSRLTGIPVDKLKEDPIKYAVALSKELNVTVVLKDAVSVITDGERVCVNVSGSPALAKAGSGDVLSGLIAGVAVREEPFEAASVGAYVLGRAGEFAAKERGDYSVTASMLPEFIGRFIAKLEE